MADARTGTTVGILAAALILAPASATIAAERLDPAGVVELVREHSPRLAASGSAVAAAEARRKLAHNGYVPRIHLTEDWVRSTDPVFVFGSKLRQESFGPADFDIDALNTPKAFTNAATRISLEQSIWGADRTRLGTQAADLGIEATTLEQRRTLDDVTFEALRAFWDAVMADEMLEVARDAEDAAEAHLELSSALVEEGLAVPSDRMSAQVRLAEVRASRIHAESGTTVARAALNRALGVDREHSFTLHAPEVVPAPIEGDTNTLISEALASRPDLQALDRRIEQARLGERIARSGRRPVIGVGAQYALNGPNPLDPTGDNWTVGLSIRVPLLDGFNSRSRTAEVRAERERAEQLRRAMIDGIELEVLVALAERTSSAERFVVARSALEQADEALRIVRERYSEGMAVMVELLGAETAHTWAKANHVLAMSDVAVADVGLDLVLGRPAGVAVSDPMEN